MSHSVTNALLVALLVASACDRANTPRPPTTTASDSQSARSPTAPAAPRPDLIPREILFANPERTSPQLSPDGKYLSWHAPHNGVLNIFLAPADNLAAAKPITTSTTHPILESHWTFDSNHLLYLQDTAGDENTHVHRVTLATNTDVDLTPIPNARVDAMLLSHRKPNTLLVALNERDPSVFDLHTIDLTTGKRRLAHRNDQRFVGFVFDLDLEPRLAQKITDTAAAVWMKKVGKHWRPHDEIPPDDSLTTSILDFDGTGRAYYSVDSRGRDKAALFLVDAKTKKKRLLHADAHVDLDGNAIMHPTERILQAVVVEHDKPRLVVLDPRVAKDFAALAELADGFPYIASRTLDDQTWIVAFESDVHSTHYYRWDRATQKGELLFAERPALDRLPLVPMHPVTIESRDGLELVSYLTLPAHADSDGDAKPNHPVPMVLFVHGGPWSRDRWHFSDIHQLLANRGYAVLAVNFRGSTGFGKSFITAGDKQWGKKMHDDLLDAVAWAIDRGVTDKDDVCIAGSSYGGYATLAGLTLTPDTFACGVDVSGPSNLVTLFENMPSYWQWERRMIPIRVGDPTTPEGRRALLDVSPLTHAAKITKPLLIGHGANDPRVKKSEADQIVSAMQANDIPVSYVAFPDEGHGFHRPENNRAFFALTEAFLSVHIGGSYEPLDTTEIAASSMVIEAGREWLPGSPTRE